MARWGGASLAAGRCRSGGPGDGGVNVNAGIFRETANPSMRLAFAAGAVGNRQLRFDSGPCCGLRYARVVRGLLLATPLQKALMVSEEDIVTVRPGMEKSSKGESR